MGDGEQDQHQDDRVGQAQEIPTTAQPTKSFVAHSDRLGVGEDEGQAASAEHDAQRGDEGRDAKQRDQPAGEQPD